MSIRRSHRHRSLAEIVVALGRHGPTGDLTKKMSTDQHAQISEITKRLA
jgi:hypothetical protein